MADAPQGPSRGPGYGLLGFLIMSFAVVGLTGLLAAHVSTLPLERALARESVLDEAVAAARAGDAAALRALKPRLGESAAVIPPEGAELRPAEFEARVAAERVAMRARLRAESDATGTRLRVMLIVVTLLGGGFGTAVMLGSLRVAPRREMG